MCPAISRRHPIRRRVLVGTALAATVMSGAFAAGASTRPEHIRAGHRATTGQPAGVRAAEPTTNGLHYSDRAVDHGRGIRLDVPGFAPRAAIELRIACMSASGPQPRADSEGVLRTTFRLPSTMAPGRYLLTIVGDGARTGAASGSGSSGAVEVTVPRVAFVDFQVHGRAHRLPALSC